MPRHPPSGRGDAAPSRSTSSASAASPMFVSTRSACSRKPARRTLRFPTRRRRRWWCAEGEVPAWQSSFRASLRLFSGCPPADQIRARRQQRHRRVQRFVGCVYRWAQLLVRPISVPPPEYRFVGAVEGLLPGRGACPQEPGGWQTISRAGSGSLTGGFLRVAVHEQAPRRAHTGNPVSCTNCLSRRYSRARSRPRRPWCSSLLLSHHDDDVASGTV